MGIINKKIIVGLSAIVVGVVGFSTANTHETITQTASQTVTVTKKAEVTKTATEKIEQTVTKDGDSLSATGTASAEYSAEATKTAEGTASATVTVSATGDCWWFNKEVIAKKLSAQAQKRAKKQAGSKASRLAKASAESEASNLAQKAAVAQARTQAMARAKTLATEKAQAALTTLETEAKLSAQAQKRAKKQADAIPTLPSARPDVASQQVALPSTGGSTTTEAPSDVALDITTSVTGYVPETGYGMWMANFVVAHNPGSGEAFMPLVIGDLVRVNGKRYRVVDKFRAYGPPETYPQSTRELTYKDFYDTSIYRAPLMFDGRMTLQTCADNGLKSVWTWKLDYA
jgi:hypothetical protein